MAQKAGYKICLVLWLGHGAPLELWFHQSR